MQAGACPQIKLHIRCIPCQANSNSNSMFYRDRLPDLEMCKDRFTWDTLSYIVIAIQNADVWILDHFGTSRSLITGVTGILEKKAEALPAANGSDDLIVLRRMAS